ncbi:MAG: hypothetical protein PVJ34_17855 [Anaerolineae bacterium]|jgi:hypothetical protein
MEDSTDRQIERMAQFLTTEHFTLQGLRNGTISEANGRLGHYLSAVGSGVVALAFVADVSELGMAFFAFSVVIFPTLIFLGIMTLIRLLQVSINDVRSVQAINRIRHFYLEMAPEAERYFSFPHHDDPEAVQRAMMPFHSPLQAFASTPGPVIMLNSVLAGAFASILAGGLLRLTLFPVVAIGLVVLVLAIWLHSQIPARIWPQETQEHMQARFPTQKD